jgi:hypothetical protein
MKVEMSSPRFDPNIIERYAEQLYRKADSVRVGSAIVGAVLGVIFGAAPISPLGPYLPIPASFGMATIILGALVGAFLGYAIGEGRAFRIRLQAQLVLFQLQLERNTAIGAATQFAPAPGAGKPPPPLSGGSVEPTPLPASVAAVAPAPQPVPAAEPVIPIQPAQRPAAARLAQAPVAQVPIAQPAQLASPLGPAPVAAPAEELAPPLLPPLSPSVSS